MTDWNEYWNRKDEHCATCGTVTKRAKGFNKQNLKRLVAFRKPTFPEVIVIIFLILFLLSSIAYRSDTAVCREYVEKNKEVWEAQTNGTFQLKCNCGDEIQKVEFTGINLSEAFNG